jgi:hypothetical protein
MKPNRAMALGLVLGVGAAATAANAQVFKCTDAEGKVTYTDVPCLRSEASALVDTRSNVADHSSIRRDAARLPRGEPAPARQSAAESPAPADSTPAVKSVVRSRSY